MSKKNPYEPHPYPAKKIQTFPKVSKTTIDEQNFNINLDLRKPLRDYELAHIVQVILSMPLIWDSTNKYYKLNDNTTKLSDLLTELEAKLETADLSIEAVTKYLNANVKNFPTDYFKAGNNIGNTGFNVNNFPSDYPDAAVLAKLDVALSTRATEATLATLFKAGQAIGALPAGTNNIGDVDVLTLPATVLAGMTSLPAGTNNIGDVDVLTLPTITQSTKHDAKTYKTAVFDASASGNLVAASTTGKVIKLHALTIQAQGTVVVNLNNGSGGASLMEWSFQAREGAVIPMANAPAYWAVTGVNTALYVTLSAAVTVTITAIYSDDDAS